MTFLKFGAIGATALLLTGPALAATVTSNDVGGDSVTNSDGTVVPLGTTGWAYANLRADTEIGITSENPRSGNGSVEFNTTSRTAKGDMQYWNNGQSMGMLTDLQSMSYDWYRIGTSTNSDLQMPSLRVLLDVNGLNTAGGFASLVFELAYNGVRPAPTDSWITSTVTGGTNVWGTSALGSTPPNFNKTLSEWQAENTDAVILGFNSGVGSGWGGEFTGYVDNISWTIGNTTTTTNFEVTGPSPVPLPAAVWLLGGALAGLGAMRRGKRG